MAQKPMDSFGPRWMLIIVFFIAGIFVGSLGMYIFLALQK